MAKKYFTSESVTEGHPDKMCDQVSDAILDALIAQDPMSRVACESVTKTGMMMCVGEVTTNAQVNYEEIIRGVIADIGYTDAAYGFDANTCSVLLGIGKQSGDIAMGVDKALEAKQGEESQFNSTGAGDQGMMFGFACDETPELMPMPIALAHKLAKQLTKVRKEGVLPYLRPDGKTQVTVEYDDFCPVRIDTIVISNQHDPDVSLDKMREDIMEYVVKPIIPADLLSDETKFYVNPTGRFVIGGPQGDSGLTGRKIIVDTYGGMGKHGGGAFSGKDPTKVDRSAAYAARHVAKNVVGAGLAKRCEVQIAYAIGIAHPVSVLVDTFGTAVVDEEKICDAITKVFDLRPAAIIKNYDLRKPIYRQLAAYGHMGREDLGVKWELLDKVEELKAAVK